MSLTDYLAIVLGALGVTLVIAIVTRWLLNDDDDDYDDDDYDYDDYDDDDYDDDDDEYKRNEVVIVHSPNYATGDISYTDMMLRLTSPHLYSEEWYDTTRREFSQWAVTQYQEIASFGSEADAA